MHTGAFHHGSELNNMCHVVFMIRDSTPMCSNVTSIKRKATDVGHLTA